MNAIELRDVRLALGNRTILDGVSLDIAASEFVGVMGPNGAGKTTLMRAILGLVPPRHGSILVLGQRAGRGGKPGGSRSIGFSTWSARATWQGGRSPSCPAVNASACCWHRR